MTPKRKNKSKRELIQDMRLQEDANRRRSMIKDTLFPYLVSMDDSIEYTKVFLQAFSGLVNGVFDERRKTTKLLHIEPQISDKLKEIFKTDDPIQKKEFDRYLGMVHALRDASVQDVSYALELPRYIDGLITKTASKESIKTVSIDEILG